LFDIKGVRGTTMLKLKRVEENDLARLIAIKRRAFEDELERYDFMADDIVSPMWHKVMMKQSIYYKVLEDGNIVGGINIFKDANSGQCFLSCLFIDKHLQNKGYGSEVMDMLQGLHCYVTKWSLETPEMSTQTHHFYEKMGYVHVGNIVPEGAPEGFTLRIYEKIVNLHILSA
jgi:GNAT superfamily N-acetyltransferase